jgi:hypothetical protein
LRLVGTVAKYFNRLSRHSGGGKKCQESFFFGVSGGFEKLLASFGWLLVATSESQQEVSSQDSVKVQPTFQCIFRKFPNCFELLKVANCSLNLSKVVFHAFRSFEKTRRARGMLRRC